MIVITFLIIFLSYYFRYFFYNNNAKIGKFRIFVSTSNDLYKINDTMKKIIASPLAPKAVGPYSQAVENNGTLYISGQLPIDASTGTMPESIEEQTRQSLTNIGHILHEAGYDYADVAKVCVLLDDIADFAAMNGVYATFFTEQMPARVCYEVAKLPMGAKVEIDAIAVK
jgi:2-iminobutanoate/2-iminopropanoate deaminase